MDLGPRLAATPSHTTVGEERFFALSLDLLTVVGFDGWFKRLNAAWERDLGWTIAELMERPYPEFIHPEDRERTLAEAARLAQPGAETRDLELRFSTRAGDYRWLLFSAQGSPEEGLIYAVGKDITDRKRAEHDLGQSEARFRAVTDSVTDALVSSDENGRIILWNPGAQRAFGYTAHEAIGRHTADLVPERLRAAHLEGLERLRRGEEPRVIGGTVGLHGLRKDGTEFPLELSLGRWISDGHPFYAAVIRDITERDATERYVAAQHAVDRVLLESLSVDEAM